MRATLPFRIAISTRALFSLEEDHEVFESGGVECYVGAQRAREDALMEKGAGFETVARLLQLNEPGRPPFVDVVVLSRNAPEQSLRVFASIEHHGLKISRASFTGGDAIEPLLRAWDIDLFLSKNESDVAAALVAGVAAAKIGLRPPADGGESETGPLRIAFDGDAVLFDEDCELIYAREGLQAFLANETARAREPLGAGPFANVLRKLAAVREARRSAGCPDRIRVALVTARCAPAHARVMRTLRVWNSEVDEAHFVGDGDKGRVLAAFGAHIFFDDQERHIASATGLVATAHVPRRSAFGASATGKSIRKRVSPRRGSK